MKCSDEMYVERGMSVGGDTKAGRGQCSEPSRPSFFESMDGIGQCSEPSRGPTGTAGKTPRRRDGTRQDGTASRRPVQGEAPRGQPR